VWPPAGIPNIFPFTEGETGRSIRDGGSDMYDGGNYLSVRIQGAWQFELPYTQDCNGLFPTELDGVDGPATSNVFYSTCKVRNGRLVPHLSRRRRTRGAGRAAAGKRRQTRYRHVRL
jgi:hypothetical protein